MMACSTAVGVGSTQALEVHNCMKTICGQPCSWACKGLEFPSNQQMLPEMWEI